MPFETWEPDPDEDLSSIVTRISGVRKKTRDRLANDPMTRELLAAAGRVIEQQFEHADLATDSEDHRYPFFKWLSRNKIAAELVRVDPTVDDGSREPQIASIVKLMERRWTPHERFIQDLLQYALNARHWSLHVALSDQALQLLLDSLKAGNLVEVIQEVAYEDLSIPTLKPAYQRIQLLAAVLAERDPDLRAVLVGIYQRLDEGWNALYDEVLSARGWKFRPGVTLQDFNLMLSSAAEGMALRALADPTGIIDTQRRTSLLGTLVLAVLVACLDTGDGKSLEELVDALVKGETPC